MTLVNDKQGWQSDISSALNGLPSFGAARKGAEGEDLVDAVPVQNSGADLSGDSVQAIVTPKPGKTWFNTEIRAIDAIDFAPKSLDDHLALLQSVFTYANIGGAYPNSKNAAAYLKGMRAIGGYGVGGNTPRIHRGTGMPWRDAWVGVLSSRKSAGVFLDGAGYGTLRKASEGVLSDKASDLVKAYRKLESLDLEALDVVSVVADEEGEEKKPVYRLSFDRFVEPPGELQRTRLTISGRKRGWFRRSVVREDKGRIVFEPALADILRESGTAPLDVALTRLRHKFPKEDLLTLSRGSLGAVWTQYTSEPAWLSALSAEGQAALRSLIATPPNTVAFAEVRSLERADHKHGSFHDGRGATFIATPEVAQALEHCTTGTPFEGAIIRRVPVKNTRS